MRRSSAAPSASKSNHTLHWAAFAAHRRPEFSAERAAGRRRSRCFGAERRLFLRRRRCRGRLRRGIEHQEVAAVGVLQERVFDDRGLIEHVSGLRNVGCARPHDRAAPRAHEFLDHRRGVVQRRRDRSHEIVFAAGGFRHVEKVGGRGCGVGHDHLDPAERLERGAQLCGVGDTGCRVRALRMTEGEDDDRRCRQQARRLRAHERDAQRHAKHGGQQPAQGVKRYEHFRFFAMEPERSFLLPAGPLRINCATVA